MFSSTGSPRSTRIPVKSVGGYDAATEESLSPVEKKMGQEVEEVMREWDENIQKRTSNTLSLRPKSTSGGNRRRTRNSSHQTPQDNVKHFEFPEIDIIKKEESNLDTSGESLDEDVRRPLYVDCPKTGRKIFRMEFDVHGYDSKNISVKVSGSRLVVHAIQKETVDGRKSSTELCRKIKIPRDVTAQNLQCTHADGILILEAPVLATNGAPATPQFSVSPSKTEPLNTPLVRSSAKGRELTLLVEVGRVFTADDVLVKVRDNDKLVVSAERQQQTDHSTLKANLVREFNLPETINPHSLRAGLTSDGILKVSASIVDSDFSVNNENTTNRTGD